MREERRRREQHEMVVRVDPGVSSYFGPIAGANWALGRAQGEVVREMQEEVMAAPAAREVDGVKEPAMADRPGRCLEEPVPGVDAVVGATVARERGGMKDLRIGLDGRGTGGDAVKKGSRTTRGAVYGCLGLLVTVQCLFGRKALAMSMETVDLFEEAQLDKKPNEKNIQIPKLSDTPKRSEISKLFMMASLGYAKREYQSSRSVA